MSNQLHDAARDKENGYEMVKFLIEEDNEDINALHSKFKSRAIDFAAQMGSLDTVKYLVEKGASLDASKTEHNILYWACQNTPDVLQYVADKEKKLFRQFNDGTTALHVAVMVGDLNAINEELNNNPDALNQKDNNGFNALYWAGYVGKKETIDFILNHNAAKHFNPALLNDWINRGSGEKYFVIGVQKDDPVAEYKKSNEFLLLINNKNETDYFALARNFSELGDFYYEQEQLEEAHHAFEASVYFYETAAKLNKKHNASLNDVKSSLKAVEQRIAMIAAAKDWGFQYKNIDADGNCFFKAVADQLKRLNIPEYNTLTHSTLRAITVAHMRAYSDHYQLFIESDDVSFSDYIDELAQDGIWADQLAITALARMLKITIAIVRCDKQIPNIMKPAESRGVVFLGFETERHYGSLHRNASYTPVKSIEDLISKESEMDTITENAAPDSESSRTGITPFFFEPLRPVSVRGNFTIDQNTPSPNRK